MKKFIIYACLYLGFVSCTPDKQESIGPNICPTPAFKFVNQLSTDKNSINFQSSTDSVLHFSAKFNENVYWTLIIKSKTTQATKTFKGYSQDVSVNWYGNPDNSNAFFGTGDCEATLSPSCIDKSSSTSFTITKQSDFSKFGVLVYDFDKIPLSKPYGILNTTFATDSVVGNVTKSPQGGKFYHMYFKTINPNQDVPYFGGKTLSFNAGKFQNENPKNLFLNFFMNTNGIHSTQAQVTFFEGNLRRTFNYTGNFDGWKLVSVRLSDMRVEDMSQIQSLDFSVGAFPNRATEAELNIDCITITKGAPLAQ